MKGKQIFENKKVTNDLKEKAVEIIYDYLENTKDGIKACHNYNNEFRINAIKKAERELNIKIEDEIEDEIMDEVYEQLKDYEERGRRK
jgi:hypothetical protein